MYAHRNGEIEVPTDRGFYWVRGSMTPNDNVGIVAISGVVEIVAPIKGTMDHYHVKFADTGLYHNVMPNEMLCRWWGPITPPWEE